MGSLISAFWQRDWWPLQISSLRRLDLALTKANARQPDCQIGLTRVRQDALFIRSSGAIKLSILLQGVSQIEGLIRVLWQRQATVRTR